MISILPPDDETNRPGDVPLKNSIRSDPLLLGDGDIWIYDLDSDGPRYPQAGGAKRRGFESGGYERALLLSGGIIRAVGDGDEMREPAGIRSEINEEISEIELDGRTVLPAFFDAHMHFYQMAAAFSALSLLDTGSLENALQETREFIQKNPGRNSFLGRQFDESRWSEGRFPTREELDQICSEKPLVWRRICGHVAVVNSAALHAMSGSTERESVGSGNRKDEGGSRDGFKPTSSFSHDEIDKGRGILLENAVYAADRLFASPGDEIENNLTKAAALAHSRGVCGINEITGIDGALTYRRSADKGTLPRLNLRVNIAVENPGELERAADILAGLLETSRMTVKTGTSPGLSTGIKLFADGSFGAHTAALTEDYAGREGERGRLLLPTARMKALVASAHDHGLPVMVHAIGDAAIEQVISAFEDVIGPDAEQDNRESGGVTIAGHEPGHSIEHLELPTAEQIERAARIGLIAGIQPNFALNWAIPGGMNEQRLGKERAARSDPVGSVYKRMRTAFGSDGMPFDPLYGIRAAVGHPVKTERISLFQAVKCYTINAAFAAGMDHLTGSIRAGKRADLVILSDRLTPENLDDIEVDMTIFGGEIVYRKE